MKVTIRTYSFRDSLGGYFATLQVGEIVESIGFRDNVIARFESRYAAKKSCGEKSAGNYGETEMKRDEIIVAVSAAVVWIVGISINARLSLGESKAERVYATATNGSIIYGYAGTNSTAQVAFLSEQTNTTNVSTWPWVKPQDLISRIEEIKWRHKLNCEMSRSGIQAGYLACRMGVSLTNYLEQLEVMWEKQLADRIAEEAKR